MAGHILGSAYVEIDLTFTSDQSGTKAKNHRVVFSGDLGTPYAPLLPAPKSPYRPDTLVIESTYGDKNHQNRKARTKNLQLIIERAVEDNGVVLIPAFSIGRTQELLYELEKTIHSHKKEQKNKQKKSTNNIQNIKIAFGITAGIVSILLSTHIWQLNLLNNIRILKNYGTKKLKEN